MGEKTQKLKAPRGTTSANIQGHEYKVNKEGLITLAVEAHRTDLHRHGFIDYEEAVTADDVKGYERDELIAFIESHGEDTDADDKTKDLRKQALALVK